VSASLHKFTAGRNKHAGGVVDGVYNSGTMSTSLATRLTAAEGTNQLAYMFCAARALREAQIPANAPGTVALFRELVTLPDADAMRRRVRESTKQLRESATLADLGIPTIDGGPVRLREARSADELGAAGVPLRSIEPLGAQPEGALARAGIPMLRDSGAPGPTPLREAASVAELSRAGVPVRDDGTGGLRRVRLTEGVSGRVVRRIS
jgi:hypothetical protein